MFYFLLQYCSLECYDLLLLLLLLSEIGLNSVTHDVDSSLCVTLAVLKLSIIPSQSQPYLEGGTASKW